MTSATAPQLNRPALFVLGLITFVSVMDSSMSSVALPEIDRAFHPGPSALSWVITAMLIPFACGTVVYGRMADIVGSRWLFLAGIALFAAGALGVAMAPNLNMIILLRIAQGAGNAAIPALTLAMITRSTDSANRGPALAYTIAGVGIGYGLGPITGGYLADTWGWRAPFFATSIASFLLLPVAWKFVPGFSGDWKQKFDYPGAILLALAVTCDIIAMNRLPNDIADPLGLAMLAISVPLWLALVFWTKRASAPFLPSKVIGNRKFLRMAFIGFSAQGAHFAVIVILPQLFTRYHDLSTIDIGLRLLPGAFCLALFGVLGGRLVNRIGPRPLIIAGSWIVFAGVLTLHLAGVDWSSWNVALLYLAIGTGVGIMNAAIGKAATEELPDALAGIGTGFYNLLFFLGGAVTVAISGGVLRARDEATEALNPLFTGTALTFSDSLIAIVVISFFAFIVAILQPPPKAAYEPDPEPVFRVLPPEPVTWPVKPRAKPNADQPRGRS